MDKTRPSRALILKLMLYVALNWYLDNLLSVFIFLELN